MCVTRARCRSQHTLAGPTRSPRSGHSTHTAHRRTARAFPDDWCVTYLTPYRLGSPAQPVDASHTHGGRVATSPAPWAHDAGGPLSPTHLQPPYRNLRRNILGAVARSACRPAHTTGHTRVPSHPQPSMVRSLSISLALALHCRSVVGAQQTRASSHNVGSTMETMSMALASIPRCSMQSRVAPIPWSRWRRASYTCPHGGKGVPSPQGKSPCVTMLSSSVGKAQDDHIVAI